MAGDHYAIKAWRVRVSKDEQFIPELLWLYAAKTFIYFVRPYLLHGLSAVPLQHFVEILCVLVIGERVCMAPSSPRPIGREFDAVSSKRTVL